MECNSPVLGENRIRYTEFSSITNSLLSGGRMGKRISLGILNPSALYNLMVAAALPKT